MTSPFSLLDTTTDSVADHENWGDFFGATTEGPRETSTLKTTLIASQVLNADLSEKISRLTRKVAPDKRKISELTKQLDALKATNTELETKITNLMQVQEDLRDETSALHLEIKSLKGEGHDKSLTIDQLRKEVQEKRLESATLEARLEESSMSLVKSKREIDNLQSKLSQKSDELENTARKLRQTEHNARISETGFLQVKSFLESEINKTKHHIKVLSEDLSQKTTQLQFTEDALIKADYDTTEALALADARRAQIEKLSEEKESITAELLQQHKNLSDLVASKIAEIEKLSEEKERISEEKESITAELLQQHKDFSRVNAKLLSSANGISARLKEANLRILALEQERDSLKLATLTP